MDSERQRDKRYGHIHSQNEMLKQHNVPWDLSVYTTSFNPRKHFKSTAYLKGIDSKYCTQKLTTVLRILARVLYE